jgi:hypothetical protein
MDGQCDPDKVDPEMLWHRMLMLQSIFNCYNSARMWAALEVGAEGRFLREC